MDGIHQLQICITCTLPVLWQCEEEQHGESIIHVPQGINERWIPTSTYMNINVGNP